MSDGNPLIDIGELSKPATVLVEKVCNAIGIIYEPTRMRRAAKAEVEIERIKAIGRLELSSLEERAIGRLLKQEARKQETIESITLEAASQLPRDSNPIELDADWIVHFFRSCEIVTNAEMKSLWARILAGEAANPSSFSKRTLDFVASMSRYDAAQFTTLCRFVWDIDGPTPLIHDPSTDVLKRAGLTFSALTHLNSIGLITFDGISGFTIRDRSDRFVAKYFGKPILVELPVERKSVLYVGMVLLTSIGMELYSVCEATNYDAHFHEAVEQWKTRGYTIKEIENT